MKPPTHICTACGTAGVPKTLTKGSTVLELALWLLFCFPGMIYSVWRLTSRYQGCAACGGQVIGINTPFGAQLAQRVPPKL